MSPASHRTSIASWRVSTIASHLARSYTPPLNRIPISATLTTKASSVGLNQGFSRTMSSIPSTMKAVLISKTGGTEVLEHKTDVPVPTAADGQVLVKNDFIGVNFIDTYFRTGLYPAPHFPYLLGREAEGTIVALGSGETHGLQVGDRIVYQTAGTYAEYVSAPASSALKIPASFKPGTAAAVLLQGLTALTLVRESHRVNKGDWVLVHAAAGGTGLLLCQFLKAIGANTIGTASTAEKVALAKANGATHVINYSVEDVKARVDELTGGKGCIAIFDGVGKDTFDLSLSCVARKGSLISFGNASGAVPPVTIARLAEKNTRLMRPTLFNYIVTREELTGWAEELFGFVERGEVGVRVHEVYPLSEVKRAHEDLEGRRTTGKLLLDPSK